MKIEELDLSVRTYLALRRYGINTTDDLCNMSEGDVVRVRNLGRKSLEELLLKMKELGLEFMEDDYEWNSAL